MEKLKPCPFCGRPAEVKATHKLYLHGWVGCPVCKVYMQWTNEPTGAMDKWNRRAGPTQPYDLLHEEGGVDA